MTKYQKRLSNPQLDRIDIHIEIPRVDYENLSNNRLGEPSAVTRRRVETTQQRQCERFASLNHHDGSKAYSVTCNADMRIAEICQYCSLDETCEGLIRSAMTQMNLSARAYPPHPQAIAHYRGLSGEREHSIPAFGRSLAISSEDFSFGII